MLNRLERLDTPVLLCNLGRLAFALGVAVAVVYSIPGILGLVTLNLGIFIATLVFALVPLLMGFAGYALFGGFAENLELLREVRDSLRRERSLLPGEPPTGG